MREVNLWAERTKGYFEKCSFYIFDVLERLYITFMMLLDTFRRIHSSQDIYLQVTAGFYL